MELPPPPKPGTPSSSCSKWVLIGLSILFAVVGVLCLCLPELVSRWVSAISPGCWFRRYTGIACTGCGGTRALQALLHGEPLEAFRHNFFFPFILIGLLLEYVRLFAVHVCKAQNWECRGYYCAFFRFFAYAALAWMIIRNIAGI